MFNMQKAPRHISDIMTEYLISVKQVSLRETKKVNLKHTTNQKTE